MKFLRFISWLILRIISASIWFVIIFPLMYFLYWIDPLYHRVIVDGLIEGYRKSDHQIKLNGRLHSVDKEVGEFIDTLMRKLKEKP